MVGTVSLPWDPPSPGLTLAAPGSYNGDQFEFNHTVSVAQLAERRTVAPEVEGSSPSTHPNFIGV